MRGHGTIVLFSIACFSALVACKPDGTNERLAREDVNFLVETSTRDVAEVERGLPEGAKRLSPETIATPAAKDIATVRRQVLDLNSAKTVVFGVVNLEGRWTVTDAEKDPYAGTSLGQGVDTLFGTAKSQPVYGNVYQRERRGKFEAAYLAASAIRDAKGNVSSYFVTGVALTEYAHRLQEALKSNLAEAARKQSNGSDVLPLYNVVIVTPKELFPAPKVPAVNVDALKAANIFEKAKANSSGTLTISDRKFGYAAAMLPKLGNDVAVAVLHSRP